VVNATRMVPGSLTFERTNFRFDLVALVCVIMTCLSVNKSLLRSGVERGCVGKWSRPEETKQSFCF
jgi:hypothetical protein